MPVSAPFPPHSPRPILIFTIPAVCFAFFLRLLTFRLVPSTFLASGGKCWQLHVISNKWWTGLVQNLKWRIYKEQLFLRIKMSRSVLFRTIFFFKIMFIYLCVYPCRGWGCTSVWDMTWSHSRVCSLSTVWVSGIKVRSLDLAEVYVLTYYRAISLVPCGPSHERGTSHELAWWNPRKNTVTFSINQRTEEAGEMVQ